MRKHIAVIDFGSQYTHLIVRVIRELGVLAVIYHDDVSPQQLQESAVGIILSGGPQSVYGEESLKVNEGIFELGLPILGVCYGHQLLASLLGGVVKQGVLGEYGPAKLELLGESEILIGVENDSQVWMSHGDSVSEVPAGFSVVGKTEDCAVTAMANDERKIFGFQFHPEVVHSKEGGKMLENFVLNICAAEKNWNIDDVTAELTQKVKGQVGDKKVFILVSGGVDSNVAFALLTKALGEERVKGLYIDTGFMRQNESEEIKGQFAKIGFHNLESIDASELFFKRLKGVFDPEEKRKIIGQTFLDAKDLAAEKMGLESAHWLLGQGTIYPDTIESGGTKNSNTIKTHHNRVDAITEMIEKGLVVEPLADLYKDEVRKVGRLLGLPSALVDRHPFPGPGLAIRCLCNEKTQSEDLREAEKKVADFFAERGIGLGSKILPIKSVGVQGDNRTYAHPLAVWGAQDWESLDELSAKTTNAIKEVNRVVLLLNAKESDPTFALSGGARYLEKGRIDLLRRVDKIVADVMREEKVYGEIDQFPVVLVPVCDKRGRESIVLRPINTRDFMTLHFYRMQKEVLARIVRDIEVMGEIGHIFFDITNKPPGTTEWE